MGRLQGKVAVITGTGGGKGRARALRFAAEPYRPTSGTRPEAE